MYFYTAGKFSFQTGEDWNRGFPGDEGSLAERRAKRLFNLTENYDYCFDLHTSRKSIPFAIVNKETYDKSLTKALGMRFTYLLSYTKDSSMMSALTKNTSSCAFEIECGSHDTYDSVNISEVGKNIVNLLTYLGVTEKTGDYKTKPGVQYIFESFYKYYSQTTGILSPCVSPGAKIGKGKTLFEIFPSNNIFKSKRTRAKSEEIVIKVIPTNIVWEGDEVIQTITKEGLKKI